MSGSPPERALGVAESWQLARTLDTERMDAAATAFRAVHAHGQESRASWRAALHSLDLLADALAAIEELQLDFELVKLMVPHVALGELANADPHWRKR